jgi:hypothetical protein
LNPPRLSAFKISPRASTNKNQTFTTHDLWISDPFEPIHQFLITSSIIASSRQFPEVLLAHTALTPSLYSHTLHPALPCSKTIPAPAPTHKSHKPVQKIIFNYHLLNNE